jgi:hypothetical protein
VRSHSEIKLLPSLLDNTADAGPAGSADPTPYTKRNILGVPCFPYGAERSRLLICC